MKPTLPSRRRFICISATVGSLSMLPSISYAVLAHSTTSKLPEHYWEGIALGADASLRISHPDPDAAQQIISRCVEEVQRLEKLFSLYRNDSTLSILNREGVVNEPASDFLALLSQSISFSELTAGKFDVTIQPLWAAYMQHFSSVSTHVNSPDNAAIQDALKLVNYRKLHVSPEKITLGQAGMAITLNGIAQGYITDRITQLLYQNGIRHALVNMGEIRGINQADNSTPWHVGLENPLVPGSFERSINLVNQAVATSSAYGTSWTPDGQYNHLLDPGSGASSSRYRSVSVVAKNATTADALSTAFSLMHESDIKPITSQLALDVYLTRHDGSHVHLS